MTYKKPPATSQPASQKPAKPASKAELLLSEIAALQLRHDVLQLKVADLEAHQDSLKDKEQYLQSIETTIDSKSAYIQTLVKESEALKDEHAFLQTAISRTKADLERAQQAHADKVAALQATEQQTEREYLATRTKTSKQHKELEEIKKEIAQRKKYADEQEALLETTINNGNKMLYDLKYDIAEMESHKQQLEHTLSQAEVELTDYIMMAGTTKNELLTELDELKNSITAKDKELATLTTKLKQKQLQFAEIDGENERKIKILKEYETRIRTIREAIVQERQDLEIEKRRWHSLKNLYDL